MTDVAHRPRSIAELVDASVQLFRRGFRELATIMAVGYIPWTAAVTFVSRRWTTAADGQLPAFSFTLALVMLAAFLWLTVVNAACMAAASERYLGRQPEVGPSFQRAFSRAAPIIGASIVTWLLAGLGLILLIVPGFYFYARFAVSPAVALFEERSTGGALSRATTLSADRKVHVLGAIGAVLLITVIITLTIQAVIALLGSAVLSQIAEAAVGIVLTPLIAVVTVVVYYDLRIRTEGFDVELMEQQLRTSAEQA
jgi:hypothetical protein